MRFDIGKAKASRPREGFIPNPKMKLLEQVSEAMRFKHYPLRTERMYQEGSNGNGIAAIRHGLAVDGVRAVAGQGRGFRAESNMVREGKDSRTG